MLGKNHFLPILIMIGFLLSCTSNKEISQTSLHGMWKLDKFEMFDSLHADWKIDSSRIGYSGYILYDGIGHMGIHLSPKGYESFETTILPENAKNADLKKLADFYRSNYTYFANYSLQGSTVTHHKLSATNPKEWGTQSVREISFKKDTLVLTTLEKVAGLQLRVLWTPLPAAK